MRKGGRKRGKEGERERKGEREEGLMLMSLLPCSQSWMPAHGTVTPTGKTSLPISTYLMWTVPTNTPRG